MIDVNLEFPGVLGVSHRMKEIARLLVLVAPSDATVLIFRLVDHER